MNESNRRRQERINIALPAYVRAHNSQGERFKVSAITDNVSQGGMFIHLPESLLPANLLFAFIRLPSQAGIAVIGRIVRTEDKGMGMMGMGVQFSHTRLLEAA